MKSLARTRGLSFFGFIIVLAVAGFFAYLGMRIGPAYIEYYNVVKAMKGVAKEPAAANWPVAQVWSELEKKMYINYVDRKSVPKSAFEIKRKGLAMTIKVKYERRDNLMYNLDYIASFEKQVEVGGRLSATD